MPHPHHIAIGAGSIAIGLAFVLFLLIPGKSRRAQASEPVVIEIMAPAIVPVLEAGLPPLVTIGTTLKLDLPRAADIEDIGSHLSGIAEVGSAIGAGIVTRSNVEMTYGQMDLVQSISHFLSSRGMQATVTSALRSGDKQLEIIKERIQQCGMASRFPGLSDATVHDRRAWTPAWEWLKAHRVPVNPPADYVDEGGNLVGGSLHLKGLAIDLVANNMNRLKDVLVQFGNSPQNFGRSGLHITALVRERNCIHLSLAE